MAELVQDWLLDYQRILGQPAEVASFAVEHETDPEIAEAIYTIFSDRNRHETLVHDICQQLLSFYRSSDEKLRKFPLQFIPVLIFNYLQAVAAGDKKGARCIETLLICIYNGEVSTDDGNQKTVSFRMPILAQASIYHEERNLPIADLKRWEENCNREVKWGPHQRIETINAQNRLKIMTALMFCYNQQVNLTQKSSLIHLCRVSSQLVNQGFVNQKGLSHRISYGSDPSPGSIIPKTPSRIPLSSAFLVELVHAIYFAMFNGYGTVAIQTLEDIHNRASFEMYTELILVTSAVRNSLHANPSGQPSDGPMGLSVALTPSTNAVPTVSKSMITNASFRTKKLPDDIPIQVQDLSMPQASQTLASVTEENENPNAKESSQTLQASQQGQSQTTQASKPSIMRPSMEGIKAQAQKALKTVKKSKDKEGKSSEPPKPPQRKLDKHTQRNSMLQMQIEGNQTILDYEKSPVALNKSKNYDSLDTCEMLAMQTLTSNENGSANYTMDSLEMNGGNGSIINNNSNPASNATSLTSSELITAKSYDSTLELPSLGGTSAKLNEISKE